MNQAPASLFVALLAGSLVGLGLGALLFGGGDPVGTAPPIRSAVARPSDAGPAPWAPSRTELARQTASTAAPRGAGGSVPLARADLDRVEAVAATVRREAVPTAAFEVGDGNVRGQVIDAEGKPVEGVLLRLGPAEDDRPIRSGSGPAKGGENLSLNDALGAAAREALEWRNASREARSAVDGRFAFEGLPDRDWRLEAFRDGFGFRAQSGSLSRFPTGIEMTVLAEPYIEVSVALTRTDGQPVDEAILVVTNTTRGKRDLVAWKASEATVWLEPGIYEVTAHCDVLWVDSGGREVAAGWKSETSDWVVEQDSAEPEALELAPANLIHGTIQYAPRVRVGNETRLLLERFEGDEPPDVGRQGWSGEGWLGSKTRYHRADLAPGRYVIGVAQDWNGPAISTDVIDYPGGVLEHHIVVDPASERPEFSVAIREPSGDAVLRAGLRVRLDRGGSRSTNFELLPFFEQGVYRFVAPEALFEEDEKVESVWLQLIDPRYAPAEVQLSASLSSYELVAAAPARVVVQVDGFEDPAHLRRARVMVDPVDESLAKRGLAVRDSGGRLDSSGRLRSKAKAPGRYRIRLLLSKTESRWNWGEPIHAQEVTLDPGDTHLVMSMPPLYTLEVLVPDDLDEAWSWFEISRIVGPDERHLSFDSGARAENGVCRFEQLPAGRYTVMSPGPDSARMDVDVPGPPVAFDGREPNAYRIHISDLDGEYAQMGFLDGDHLLAVDGDKVAVKQLGDRSWNLLRFSRGAHTATVQRDGQERTLEWEVEALSATNRGGSLTPAFVELE